MEINKNSIYLRINLYLIEKKFSQNSNLQFPVVGEFGSEMSGVLATGCPLLLHASSKVTSKISLIKTPKA